MSHFWSQTVHHLSPYVPGEQPKQQNITKLNTNENPYAPSAKVFEALHEQINDRLRLYPDPNAEELKASIADYYQLKQNQIFVGNGSDEVLAHVFQALLKQQKPLLFPDITYSFYPVYCGLYDIDYTTIPLNAHFQLNINDYKQTNGGIIFPNPNAPTGVGLSLSSIESLLQYNQESVVVIDEAYIDFGGQSAVELINRFPNLLVIQTFSKSRSLAGLRVGFAMGHHELIDGLERVKNSFNSYPLDRLAIKGAVSAIKDQAYFTETTAKIIEQREQLTEQLKQMDFHILPSQANFIFVQHRQQSAKALHEALRAQGIIVRHFRQPRIEAFLRITIGTAEECTQLVTALNKIMR